MTNPHERHSNVPEFTAADRARKALQFAGMGVSDMAEYLGMTRETVGRYINDKQPMPLQTRRLWALRTGVPFEWLENGESPHEAGCPKCAIRDLNPEPADSLPAQVIGLFSRQPVSA